MLHDIVCVICCGLRVVRCYYRDVYGVCASRCVVLCMLGVVGCDVSHCVLWCVHCVLCVAWCVMCFMLCVLYCVSCCALCGMLDVL